MTIGDPTVFAIEYEITRAYERLSFRALGFFNIHIRGQGYGVRSPESSMLACSYDAVSKRLADQGLHSAPFADEDAGGIADSVLQALFAEEHQERSFFGLSREQFSELVYSRQLIWAPDGDEAFDDGSYVLQFDIANGVRLIGYKHAAGYTHDPLTLTDLSIPAAEFYGVLERWRREFEAEWTSLPKAREEDP